MGSEVGQSRGTSRLNPEEKGWGNHLGSDGVPEAKCYPMDAIPDRKSEMAPEACCQKWQEERAKTQIREQRVIKDHLFLVEERMNLLAFQLCMCITLIKERARAVLDFLDSCDGSKRF